MPKVSIVTPCYNRVAYIARTIESVQQQSLTDWEHVVVDDGSTDASADIVERYARGEPRLRLIRGPHSGISSARNRGAAACSPSSEYFYFLDSDDMPQPNMLEVMTDYLDAHPEVALAYCRYQPVDEEGRPVYQDDLQVRYIPTRLGLHTLTPSEAMTPFFSVYVTSGLVPSVSLLRRSVYEERSGFDEHFGSPGEDKKLFLEIALHHRIHHLYRRLVHYRRHDGQMTIDLESLDRSEEQLRALFQNMTALSEEKRAVVRRAEHMRMGRLGALNSARAARDHWRQREALRAFRLGAVAVRRYLLSFLPTARVKIR